MEAKCNDYNGDEAAHSFFFPPISTQNRAVTYEQDRMYNFLNFNFRFG